MTGLSRFQNVSDLIVSRFGCFKSMFSFELNIECFYIYKGLVVCLWFSCRYTYNQSHGSMVCVLGFRRLSRKVESSQLVENTSGILV